MSEVLRMGELPPEAASFLKAGTLQPTVERRASTESETEGNGTVSVAGAAPVKEDVVARKPVREKPAPMPVEPSLVSMTFRLPSEIPAGLIRASADQKLKHETPCSQQDIVAEALSQWLRKHGY